MEKIPEWIDGIIEDLVNPSIKLSDTLLKVQILASKLKNDKLKIWIDHELNGYLGEGVEVPEYRVIGAAVYGNIEQNRFGSILRRSNSPLPIEVLGRETMIELQKIPMNSAISQIEELPRKGKTLQVDLPHSLHQHISKKLSHGWYVTEAWQQFNTSSIDGILSSLKSKLLAFLLELNDELGSNTNFSIMDNKKDVDKLFDKSIGSISGQTVNVSIGDQKVQNLNQGNNSNANISQGDNNTQNIDSTIKGEIEEMLSLIKENIADFGLNQEDQEDVNIEVQRLENQVQRESWKPSIINGSLQTLHGILIGVTGNVLTPVILDKINSIVQYFGG